MKIGGIKNVSSHAPVKGATDANDAAIAAAEEVSSHAPVKGATTGRGRAPSASEKFQVMPP